MRKEVLLLLTVLFVSCHKEDTVPPYIRLKGRSIMQIELHNNFNEPGYIAEDNEDGNITEKVEVINNVNTNEIGEYEIIYKVNDKAGNTGIARRKIIVYLSYDNILAESILPFNAPCRKNFILNKNLVKGSFNI